MTTTTPLTQFLHQKRPAINALAMAYTLLAYAGGILLILQASLGWNVLGVGLLTHALVLSAYWSHEFMHGTIFERRSWNTAWGNLMLWINGSCYARFDDLAKLHIGHHVNRVDFHPIDLSAYVRSLPPFLRSLILGLEWLYFPALAFLMRFRSITAPFWKADRKDERWRVMLIFLVRTSLFIGLAVLSMKAVLLYFVAFVAMIHVLRFVDAFQHTYEVFPMGTPVPKRDRAHEQANTFSNLVSQRYPWLNLLILNFSYHNAHHELMKCPWYNLPALDRTLFRGDEPHYIPLPKLVRNYHRFRVSRIFSGQGSARDAAGNPSLDAFYGAVEVSLLVLPA
ncbi:MAG TPA: fatty acid desaturase [Synechococcales cyanobacterium M55_K2018_004]|nr:fatty acid desaturase [Synechococcales cyanobacterium M55_K2018_004]